MLTPLITAPYLSRVLGAGNIGIQSYTHSIATYFILVGCLGIGSYGAREVSRNRDNKEKISKLFWELNFVKYSVFACVLIVYTFLILFSKNHSIFYLILLMSLFAYMFDITWFFEGLEKFQTISIRNTCLKILQVVLTLTLVKGKNALIIYMIIFSLTELISALSLWLGVRKFINKVELKKLNIRQHYKETFVYFIPAIASTIYCSIDKVMIKWIVNNNDFNGYYEQAKKITSIIETIVFSLNSVMAARMSLLYKENKIDEMKQGILKSFDFIFFIIFPMMFGISAISNNFVPIFFGAGYDEVIFLIPMMCPLVLIISISHCLGSQYLTPSGQRARSSKAIITGMFVNIILNAVFIPILGVFGAIIASIVAELVITIMYLYMCKGIIKIKDLVKYIGKRFIASLVMFIIVVYVGKLLSRDLLSLIIQVAIGVISYVILLFIFRDKFLIKYTKFYFEKIFCRKNKNIKGQNNNILTNSAKLDSKNNKKENTNIKIKLNEKFFEDEIRCEYKVSSDMKKVWAVELDLLSEFDRVCKKYDIKYFLVAGTMLGAVRHKGFIPWDDDIDVAMLRPEYDKLIKISLTTDEFKHPYFLQNAYNDINYTHGHAQLRNSETTGILKSEKNCKIEFNQGIFIDVFVLDAIPDNEVERIKQNKILNKAGKMLFRRYNPCFIYQEKNKFKRLIKKIYRVIFRIGHTLEKDYSKLECYLRDCYNNGSNVDAIMYRMRNDKNCISKDLFNSFITCKFENFDFPIIEKYDELLKIYFGQNYMIPKVSLTEHGGVIYDTQTSYKYYKKENTKF